MGRLAGRRTDERGVVLPTRLTAFGISALALGALVLVTTGLPHQPEHVAAPVVAKPTPTPVVTTPAPTRKPKVKPKPKAPAVKRRDVYVEVYNNSGIHGLANQTAARAQAAGWNVVGSDNWYGTIDASTVYYPQRLTAAAKALGRDLGIKRLKPAIAPMRFDRLTVILTSDYH
jgi:hypothetical protein